MTEMPEYFISLADQNFNTHKLWKQKDEDNYLFEIRESIDAIAVMGGYKITPDLMKSMPNLKIIACLTIFVVMFLKSCVCCRYIWLQIFMFINILCKHRF